MLMMALPSQVSPLGSLGYEQFSCIWGHPGLLFLHLLSSCCPWAWVPLPCAPAALLFLDCLGMLTIALPGVLGSWVSLLLQGSGVLYAAPTTGRVTVRCATTGGWAMGSAMLREASGHTCHLPLLGSGHGLSHECCCSSCSLWLLVCIIVFETSLQGTLLLPGKSTF